MLDEGDARAAEVPSAPPARARAHPASPREGAGLYGDDADRGSDMSLAETDEDDTSASEGLGGCFLDNQLPGTCPLKKRHKWDEVASAGRHVAAPRRDAPEPTAPRHPSPPPPSETHRAADDEDTRRGREDRDRDPSPATRRLERDFAVAEEGELKAARVSFSLKPANRRRRSIRVVVVPRRGEIPGSPPSSSPPPSSPPPSSPPPSVPPRGRPRDAFEEYSCVEMDGYVPGAGVAGFATPASSDAGFPFHGAFCVRTARQLNEICQKPEAFKEKWCKEHLATGSCALGRMCSRAHHERQLKRHDGGWGTRPGNEKYAYGPIARQRVRANVHLTLCWARGCAVWLDEFEAAYLFVVGERFEAPKKSLNAAFGASNRARWLERVASPATCEIFERTDPRSGRKRKAVTLARHEDLEKRLEAMTWTCKECKAQHPHFHASFCGGCGAARKKKATPRR